MIKVCSAVVLTAIFFTVACTGNHVSDKNILTGNPDSLTGKKAYVNPVDGKVYQTKGEFRHYVPEGGVRSRSGPVQFRNIVLLTDEEALAQVTNADVLADFIQRIDTVVVRAFGVTKDTSELIVQCTLYAGRKAEIKISYAGTPNSSALTKIYKQVQRLATDVDINKDSCVFQTVFAINSKESIR